MASVKHPAPFNDELLKQADLLLPRKGLILDPFAGEGRAARLAEGAPGREVYGVEIERAWCELARANGMRVVQGDARTLPFPPGTFDAVVTSPVYGNRLSDIDASQARAGRKRTGEEAEDDKRSDQTRRTYRAYLGTELNPANAGGMQWREGEGLADAQVMNRLGQATRQTVRARRDGTAYRALHQAVWAEVYRVLKPGGLFVFNCKDHQRDGVRQEVTRWHSAVFATLGFHWVAGLKVGATGDQNSGRHGKQGKAVILYETIDVWRKPREAKPERLPLPEWACRALGLD